jgi:hypothetical protein
MWSVYIYPIIILLLVMPHMVLLAAIIKGLWKSRSPMAKRHLNAVSDYVLINCINLFQAYFYITLKAKVLSERGYEISEHWIEASDSVSDHLNNYCVPCLSPDDNYSFECQLPRLFTVALNFHRRSLSMEV